MQPFIYVELIDDRIAHRFNNFSFVDFIILYRSKFCFREHLPFYFTHFILLPFLLCLVYPIFGRYRNALYYVFSVCLCLHTYKLSKNYVISSYNLQFVIDDTVFHTKLSIVFFLPFYSRKKGRDFFLYTKNCRKKSYNKFL